MDRGLTQQLIDAIEAQSVVYYEIIDVTLTLNGSDVTYHLTNAPFAITVDTTTYEAWGALVSLDVIEENATFEIGQLAIGISGIAPIEPSTGDPFLEVMLRDTTEYVDREVVVQRAYLTTDYNYIGAVEVFRGFISGATAVYSESGDCAVAINCANHWTDFERITGRKTNSNSQQFYFPGDTGLDFSVEVQKDLTWK